MPTNYFTDIEDLQSYVGGAVNSSLQLETINPSFSAAYHQYLEKWVNIELVDAFYSNTDEEYAQGKDLFKRVLAYIGLLEFTDVASVHVSDSGMNRIESENTKNVYKYQANNYKDSMRRNGFMYMDALISYIYKERENLSEFNLGDEYDSFFILTVKAFKKHYRADIDRYTFEMLLPVMLEIQEFAILGTFGELLYELFLTIKKSSSPTPLQVKVLSLLQKAIAAFTISEGLKRLAIRLDAGKIIYNERSDSQSTEYQRQATDQRIGLVLKHEDIVGNRWISRLIDLLENNRTELNVPEDWNKKEDDKSDTGCQAKKDKSKSKIIRF